MIQMLHIDGIKWAADILNGNRQFPTFNETDHVKKDEADDFADIFAAELSKIPSEENNAKGNIGCQDRKM